MTVGSPDGEPEIVLTPPPEMDAEQFVRTPYRATLGAITQLVAAARGHVVLGSPFLEFNEVLYAGPIGQALTAAMHRGVCVDLVSTASALAGIASGSQFDHYARGRLRLFQPGGNRADDRALGSHAKFCLVDRAHAYLGSANFTEKGMTRHLEFGVIVHGAAAHRFWEILDLLFRTGYFSEFRQPSSAP